MDIIIKSFNRPYYLDRCIRSIQKFVEGEHRIIVLDDGTPPIYLEKIKNDFPFVELRLSKSYNDKVEEVERYLRRGGKFKRYNIPVDLWVSAAEDSSDIFLLMEDDIWFTAPVNLDTLEKEIKRNELVMVRLFWQGNPNYIRGKKQELNCVLEEVKPGIPMAYRLVFENRYKTRDILDLLWPLKSVLYRAKVIQDDYIMRLPFYTIYSVAAAIYRKDYWLYLWEKDQKTVNETQQLLKAAEWFTCKGARYGKMTKEVVQTSYISSATNDFPGVDLDVFFFNHVLNEMWLQGRFDAMQNFPKDYGLDYISSFLEESGLPHCSYAEWIRWIDLFKSQYRFLGCIID